MASTVMKSNCLGCGKISITYDCKGCQEAFCYNHLIMHNQQLNQQYDDIENQSNVFKQKIDQHQQNISPHPLLQQINEWEQDSIQKIQKTAEEARNIINQHKSEHLKQIDSKLEKLTDGMGRLKCDNDFNEIDINNFKVQLDELQKQLNKPKHIRIREDSTLVKKIEVFVSARQINLTTDMKWNPNAVTVAGGHGQGQALNQLSIPNGIDIDDNDGTIVVSEYGNSRIVEWKKDATTGRIVAGGNGHLANSHSIIIDHWNNEFIIADTGNKRVVRWPRQGATSGQTIISNVQCIGLAMNKDDDLYVVDHEKHEVRRWKTGDKEGTLVAGGNGAGTHLNQLSTPRYVFVDENESVYVSEYSNHRVMKWMKGAKEGIVVAGGHGAGSSLKQLNGANGIFVDEFETVYVADRFNHRIMRWVKGSTEGEIVVGGNGQGNQSNQLWYPFDVVFDNESNLYVADGYNHRVQKFSIVKNE